MGLPGSTRRVVRCALTHIAAADPKQLVALWRFVELPLCCPGPEGWSAWCVLVVCAGRQLCALRALNEQHGSTPEQGKPEMNRSIPLEIDSRGQHIERNSGGFMTQGWGGWRRERNGQAEARGTRGRNEVIRVNVHPGGVCRSRAAHTTRHLARGKQARGRKGRAGGGIGHLFLPHRQHRPRHLLPTDD